jgi:hypothetical protein
MRWGHHYCVTIVTRRNVMTDEFSTPWNGDILGAHAPTCRQFQSLTFCEARTVQYEISFWRCVTENASTF